MKYQGINYVVTGHSSMNGDVQQSSNSTLLWVAEGSSGFTRWTATANMLHLEFIEANTSNVLYDYSFIEPLNSLREYDSSVDPAKSWIIIFFQRIAKIYNLKQESAFLVGVVFIFLCCIGIAYFLTVFTLRLLFLKRNRALVHVGHNPYRSRDLYNGETKNTLYFEAVQSQHNTPHMVKPQIPLFQQIYHATGGKSKYEWEWKEREYESLLFNEMGSHTEYPRQSRLTFAHLFKQQQNDKFAHSPNSTSWGTSHGDEMDSEPSSLTSSIGASTASIFESSASIQSLTTHFVHHQDEQTRPRRHSIW